MATIVGLSARELLDSRSNPTIEVEAALSDGATGVAAVPSGASTGAHEVVELRDGDPKRFGGLGVRRAVENVRSVIAPELVGRSALDQGAIDELLVELDGTPNKSRLGGNAVLGVSVAVARAASDSEGVPLYRYLAGGGPVTLPVPMFNILNGGRHAENSTDIQEFMVVPLGVETFSDAIRAGSEVYQSLKRLLSKRGLATTVGDEGGFAPRVGSNQEALDLLLQGIEGAGYGAGDSCVIALDAAASEFLAHDGRYSLARDGTVLTGDELIDTYGEWVESYPIVSIEDGMAEEDWDGWRAMSRRLADRVQLVGDDLYATNPGRIRRGIELGASNAVLIKLNQIGTVTETLQAVTLTREAGWATVVSHRSGETEDTTIADLAVGAAAGQIKAGAPARGERTAKYNRLLRIEEELGADAVYAGRSPYEQLLSDRSA